MFKLGVSPAARNSHPFALAFVAEFDDKYRPSLSPRGKGLGMDAAGLRHTRPLPEKSARHSPRDDENSSFLPGSPAVPLVGDSFESVDALPLAGLAHCEWPDLDADMTDSVVAGTKILDQDIAVRIVLGRVFGDIETEMPLPVGRVVVLDTEAHAPVEIWRETQIIARGQLRTLDGRYCVQITELLEQPTRKRQP